MKMFTRQSFLGPNSQTLLAGARVAIVGACGGGSHVAQQLGHIGVGTVIVIDPQRIDLTNLHRLVGAHWLDVLLKTAKVSIARRVIRSVNRRATVIALKRYWQSETAALLACDVIVGCLDSPRAKSELEAFCRRFLIPYIDIGMDVHGEPGEHLIAGQVVLSMPDAPCLKCLGVVTDAALAAEGARYGSAGGLPQVVWPNGVLASTAVGLVMQILTPWMTRPNQSVYLYYDGNSGVVAPSHRHKLALQRRCPHYPASERGDPGFDIRKAPAAPERGWASLEIWLRKVRGR